MIFHLCALLLMAAPLLATAEESYAPVSVDITPIKVSERVWYVPGQAGAATDYEGFISNSGFVVTDESVVIFDALGTPSLAWAMLQEIRKITDKPVSRVIVSHYHADHIYGLEVFKDLGAEIVAPAEAIDYLESPVAAERLEERSFSLDPWVKETTRLIRPDRLIEDNWEFQEGGVRFKVSYLGKAHSDGDLTLLIEPDLVLFTGDVIFEGRIPFVGNADTRRWLENLESMQTTGLAALIPGHGPAADKPDDAIIMTRDYLAFLRQTFGTAVDELQEFEEAYAEADWSRFEKLPAFEAANRINAFGVYLSLERELLQ